MNINDIVNRDKATRLAEEISIIFDNEPIMESMIACTIFLAFIRKDKDIDSTIF